MTIWPGLYPTRTEKRMDWLAHLALHGPDVRDGRGVVACQCMRLGWTRWIKPLPVGGPWLEELTNEGRAILSEGLDAPAAT